jgi:hypothetical protein
MLSNGGAGSGEQQPLIQKVAPSSMGSACFLTVVGALVVGWCVLDSWRQQMSSNLFGVAQVKNAHVSHPFTYPLTLAFFQFAFMGIFFLSIWSVTARNAAADIAKLGRNLFTPQWTGLVATHVFSTFWLQSLMMPAQMMSPAVFAASRALQVPAAAGFRWGTMGSRYGGHPLPTTGMMFAAAALLIYSQYAIAECLCVWSGHGIQLAGIALVIIYLLVLILPAANAVSMEWVVVDLDTNPWLMLATMNILACLCFAPILGFAHYAGWEDVGMAFAVTTAHPALYMLVLWLGVQMVLFSVAMVALIAMVDSFWAVALTTSFKAVFWWCSHLMQMYIGCPLTNVAIQHPHASLWSFIILIGCLLVGIAAKIDASTPKEHFMDTKNFLDDLKPPSSSSSSRWI